MDDLLNNKVNSKVKFYPNGTAVVTCFNTPMYRTTEKENKKSETWDNFFTINTPFPADGSQVQSYYDNEIGEYVTVRYKHKEERNWGETIRLDSLKRTMQKIFDMAYANADVFTYFVTFTLASNKINRYDIKEISPKFKQWLKNSVKRKDMNYVIVPEYHKNGAIHFHGLISANFDFVESGTYLIPDKKKPVKESVLWKYGYTIDDPWVREVYNISDYPFGFATAIKLDDNRLAVCRYITKYITKDSKRIFGNFILQAERGWFAPYLPN